MAKSVSSKIFIDTHFVIALINERDSHHHRAIRLSEQYQGWSFVTTDAVLLEIGNALGRHFKQSAIDTINYFIEADNTELVHLTPQLFEQAFTLYQCYQDKDWGMMDCVSFVVMREQNITTFDQHFLQAGFLAMMRDE